MTQHLQHIERSRFPFITANRSARACQLSGPVAALFAPQISVICPAPSSPSFPSAYLVDKKLVGLLDELTADLTIPRQPKRKAAEATIPTEGRSLRQRRLPPEGTKHTADPIKAALPTVPTASKPVKSAHLANVIEGASKPSSTLSSLHGGPPTPQTAISVAMDSDDDFMSNMSSEDDAMHDDSDNGLLSGGEGEFIRLTLFTFATCLLLVIY